MRPPLVGYLLAGVVVGPFTPGFVADQALANELAEIGVILLMFGVGLHFSLKRPAVGARHRHSRRAGADRGGDGAWAWAWAGPWAGRRRGLVFGLALSVASTVVLLRALQERRLDSRPSAAASPSAG
jgi:CPA2 family monovalent cation:H+ antiporter-2